MLIWSSVDAQTYESTEEFKVVECKANSFFPGVYTILNPYDHFHLVSVQSVDGPFLVPQGNVQGGNNQIPERMLKSVKWNNPEGVRIGVTFEDTDTLSAIIRHAAIVQTLSWGYYETLGIAPPQYPPTRMALIQRWRLVQ